MQECIDYFITKGKVAMKVVTKFSINRSPIVIDPCFPVNECEVHEKIILINFKIHDNQCYKIEIYILQIKEIKVRNIL